MSAQDFKWKTAGKVKATGVHDTDPRIERKEEVFWPIAIVNKTVKPTSKVRVTFFKNCLFLVLAIFGYK